MFESLLKRLCAELNVRAIMLKNRDINKQEIQRWLVEYDQELGEGFEERFLNLLKDL